MIGYDGLYDGRGKIRSLISPDDGAEAEEKGENILVSLVVSLCPPRREVERVRESNGMVNCTVGHE